MVSYTSNRYSQQAGLKIVNRTLSHSAQVTMCVKMCTLLRIPLIVFWGVGGAGEM